MSLQVAAFSPIVLLLLIIRYALVDWITHLYIQVYSYSSSYLFYLFSIFEYKENENNRKSPSAENLL